MCRRRPPPTSESGQAQGCAQGEDRLLIRGCALWILRGAPCGVWRFGY